MTAVSAQEALTSANCSAYACSKDATSEDGLCDEHREWLSQRKPYQRGVKGARKWTPTEILEAVRRWTREHGKPPRAIDWQANASVRGDYPSYNAAVDCAYEAGWGGWQGLLEQAGVVERSAPPPQKPTAVPDPPPEPPAADTASDSAPSDEEPKAEATPQTPDIVDAAFELHEAVEEAEAAMARLDAAWDAFYGFGAELEKRSEALRT